MRRLSAAGIKRLFIGAELPAAEVRRLPAGAERPFVGDEVGRRRRAKSDNRKCGERDEKRGGVSDEKCGGVNGMFYLVTGSVLSHCLSRGAYQELRRAFLFVFLVLAEAVCQVARRKESILCYTVDDSTATPLHGS